mgnify:CR=1 FL=1|jgi:hypothetical protein
MENYKTDINKNQAFVFSYLVGLVLMCFLSLTFYISIPAVSAQPAEFSGDTGILEVPVIVINGQQAISEAELQLQDTDSIMFKLVDYAEIQENDVQELRLAHGESTTLADGRTMRFINVLSESRCPSDVVCVTSGEVTVILRIITTLDGGNTTRTDFGLTLGGFDISSHFDSGLYYRLTEATPVPVSTIEVVDEEYEILVEYSALPFSK